MKTTFSTERLTDAIFQAVRHWEEKKLNPLEQEPPFTIAISREAGAKGSQIARAVGKRLGWPVYDRELLEKIAEEMGLRTKLLESLDEKRVSWLQECVEAFMSPPTVSEFGFVRHLIETVLSLGAHGESVIVGRGAAQILSPKTTLRVRLFGPLGERIKTVENRFGISQRDAAAWVERTDYARRQFVLDHFNQAPEDPSFYDLVLNSSRFSVEECAELIVEALTRLQAHNRAKRPVLARNCEMSGAS